MVHIDFNRPLDSPAYRPQLKCIDPIIGGALIGVGGGLLNGLFGSTSQSQQTAENMRRQHKYNINEMQQSMDLQRNQQEFLMNSMYGKTASGMKSAGFNPATANGVSPSVPSGGSPSTGGTAPSAPMPDFGLDKLVGTGISLAQASEDLKTKRLNNDILKIERDRAKANELEHNTVRKYYDPDTGDEISDDKLEQWIKDHPGKLPSVDTFVDRTESRFGREKAKQEMDEWKTQSQERVTRREVANASRVRADIEKKIDEGKLNDPAVMNALVKLPAQEYARIVQLIEKEGVEKAFLTLQKEDFANTKLSSVIEKIKDPKMSFTDKLMTLCVMIGSRMLR